VLRHFLVPEAGGVGHQVVDHDRLLALTNQLGEVVRNCPIQAEDAVLDERQGGRRANRFRNQPKRKDRVQWKGRVGRGIKPPERFVQDDDSAASDQDYERRRHSLRHPGPS